MLGPAGAVIFFPFDDLGLVAFAAADGTDGDKLSDGGTFDDILVNTDNDTDIDTLRENKLTRSDCLITLTNLMTEVKSVTIARNYYVVSLRTVQNQTALS